MTYSIGFRAPSAQELVSEFLHYLQEKTEGSSVYTDPDLELQQHPAEISKAMLSQVGRMLQEVQWGEEDIALFLGQYVSAPKPHVVFDPPDYMEEKAFHKQLVQQGITLARQSQLLFHGQHFFMNGERAMFSEAALDQLRLLADQRYLPRGVVDQGLAEKLYEWYLAGYLQFPESED